MSELELLGKARNKSILFCGEEIVDVYHYVRPLGRPTKDAILSVELVEKEIFSGGVVAASAHLQDFCDNVDIYTGGVITTKTRFVEKSHFHKLFQYYETTNGNPGNMLEDCRDYDAVIVTDYGHGMANQEFIEAVDGAPFLAVNVQTNSGNYGYNLATKYYACDYLCVDEAEARLATQNRDGRIEDSLMKLASKSQKTVITLGKKGAIGTDSTGDIYGCPAFTDKVVDTMGAGDAFFAITALVAEEASMDQLLRIGNAAGAAKSQIVGHRTHVTRQDLEKYLR